MKAIIDKETCTGCGLCPDTCPDIFEMDGEVARVIADPVPENSEDCAREAADGCPVEASSLKDN